LLCAFIKYNSTESPLYQRSEGPAVRPIQGGNERRRTCRWLLQVFCCQRLSQLSLIMQISMEQHPQWPAVGELGQWLQNTEVDSPQCPLAIGGHMRLCLQAPSTLQWGEKRLKDSSHLLAWRSLHSAH
jgi:hypothetical protein